MNETHADEAIYYQLRECLGNMPQGFPMTETRVELKILKKMFTQEQARIYVAISQSFSLAKAKPGSKKLQDLLNMSEALLADRLEEMARTGLLFRLRDKSKSDEPFYISPAFIIGLYEFSVNAMDKELADLFNEYIPFVAEWMNKIPTKQLRVIPVESAVQPSTTVLPYDRVEEIIKGHYAIAVTPCVCASELKLRGHTCKAPLERCISFDYFAEHYIDTGIGREINEDQLRSILKMGEEKGLIISPSNTKESLGFCLCCDCCCTGIRIACSDPSPATQIQACYLAVINDEECSQCGQCVDRCNLQAIRINGSVTIDKDRCVGCGLCVDSCPSDAITLVSSGRTPEIPQSGSSLYFKMYESHIKENSFNNSFLDNHKLLLKVKATKTIYNLIKFLSGR